ncbi:hypothetical protein [Rhizobium leguminosarum]|uniref:hypothetical protein n=1 Tax=Rhizobium leguminosarum TaxID=384 RepID=UPI0028F45EC6|nr:hypothetical protein [Rhizobium leguminosarum]
MHVMMLMGHDDELAICDINPTAQTIASHTTYGLFTCGSLAISIALNRFEPTTRLLKLNINENSCSSPSAYRYKGQARTCRARL